MRTFAIRYERSFESAMKIAEFLEDLIEDLRQSLSNV